MTRTASNIVSLQDFLTGDIELSSPPEIFTRISQMLDDPTKNADDIAALIEQDPSLAARMLRLVNSAFYGFPATITCISKAVTILGNSEIRFLVMATSVVDKFSNMPNSILNMREFWTHSVKVALFAQFIAERHPKKRQLSSAFISGLLHDIGRLILYSRAPDLARSASLMTKSSDLSEVEAETKVFGFNHAQLGHGLLELWKIPENVQQAACYHHNPLDADSHQTEVQIIYLANQLAHANTSDVAQLELDVSPLDPVWNHIDIQYNLIHPIIQKVDEQFLKTYSLFFN